MADARITERQDYRAIGAASSTDCNDLEVRFETLSAGLSKVVIPVMPHFY